MFKLRLLDLKSSGYVCWVSRVQATFAGYQEFRLRLLVIKRSGYVCWISMVQAMLAGYQEVSQSLKKQRGTSPVLEYGTVCDTAHRTGEVPLCFVNEWLKTELIVRQFHLALYCEAL